MNYNKIILAGRLTRDVELRYTPKGTAVAQVTLAINRRWSDSGVDREETTFVDVEAWGRQAEVLAQYLKKGRELMIDGRLRQDTWEDKETSKKHSKLKVVLETFQFVSGEKEPKAEQPARPAATPSKETAPTNQAADDDVPF